MTTRTLQILLALARGPLHGYGIKQSVEDRTKGQVKLGSGTLYEAVARLVDGGQIQEVAAPAAEPRSGGPPRRFYTLTDAGRRELSEELGRMDAVVRYARDEALIPEG